MNTAFSDPRIEIIGPNRMQNELLMSLIRKETNAPCQCGGSLRSCLLSMDDCAERLILFDCTGRETQEIHDALMVEGIQDGIPCAVVLFNVEPSLEIKMERLIYSGVRGVFFSDDPTDKIIRGVQAIIAGELWFPRRVLAHCILAGSNGTGRHANSLGELTFREKEILRKIGDGMSNKEIAHELAISFNTVKTHVYKIYKKIQVGNRMQAAIWAARYLG